MHVQKQLESLEHQKEIQGFRSFMFSFQFFCKYSFKETTFPHRIQKHFKFVSSTSNITTL